MNENLSSYVGNKKDLGVTYTGNNHFSSTYFDAFPFVDSSLVLLFKTVTLMARFYSEMNIIYNMPC